MHLDHLRLFLAIARRRSLSRAALEMDLSQATVSERLKALEAEVGAALFSRHGRGVTLTPAGQAFEPYAERALEVLREAQASARAAAQGARGQVTIAVTVTSGAYLFAPVLAAFRRQHPGIEVKVRSAHSWDAPGLLLDGVAQLALISGPSLHPQIESVAAVAAPLVLAASPRHPLARAGRVTLEQLAREQFLVSYWGPASQAFLERVRAAGEPAAGSWMELSPVELVKGMLIAGAGVSLVPEIAVRRELAAGELAALAFAGARLPRWEISLIRLRRGKSAGRGHVPRSGDALAEMLRRSLPELVR